MNTLINKLTNLLTSYRSVLDDGTVTGHPTTHGRVNHEDKVLATQLESQTAANYDNGRPDWFQAIHGTDY